MDKIYYKELIEKYFDGNITDAEIKELSDWIMKKQASRKMILPNV